MTNIDYGEAYELPAFASAAASNAPKTSALQKSKTAIGLRVSDSVKPVRKGEGDEHSHRVAEVSRLQLRTERLSDATH